MRNFVTLLKKNLLEMIRNKKIIVFGIVFVAFAIISVVSARFLPLLVEWILSEAGGEAAFILDPTVADSYVQFIGSMDDIAMLLVPLMFVATIVKEKVTGTYAVLKMNKVKDKEIVLAHLTAQVIIISLCYLLSVAVFVILNILVFKQIMGIRGFIVLLYLYLLLIFNMCLSLFVSCLSKKKGKSYLLFILIYFAMSIVSIIPKVNLFLPSNLLTLGNELVMYETYTLSEHLISVISSILISGLLVVGAILLVKNRINNKVSNDDNSKRV